MVLCYRKGSRAEHELIDYFSGNGYCVIRAAGSGVNSLSPDILVFRRGVQCGIEAKAHETHSLGIDREQFENLKRWEDISGITCLIGWRRSREPWYLIPLSVFKENPKSYSVNWEQAQAIGKKIEEFK